MVDLFCSDYNLNYKNLFNLLARQFHISTADGFSNFYLNAYFLNVRFELKMIIKNFGF